MSYRGSLLCFAAAMGLSVAGFIATSRADDSQGNHAQGTNTATPIKHLVVIFQENVSFDHYFGTYPKAQNNPGETKFVAKPNTPVVNNLATPLDVNHNFAP